MTTEHDIKKTWHKTTENDNKTTEQNKKAWQLDNRT